MQRSFLAQRTPLAAAIAIAIALSAGSAAAHTLDDGIPQTNGLRIDMAAVAAYLHGDSTLPAPRLAGTLGLGDTPDDQRGWRLEHGTLGAGLRVSPQLGPTSRWAGTTATQPTWRPPGWKRAAAQTPS